MENRIANALTLLALLPLNSQKSWHMEPLRFPHRLPGGERPDDGDESYSEASKQPTKQQTKPIRKSKP